MLGDDVDLDDPLWTIKDVATYLGVRERTVKELVFQRQVAVVKIGRLVRVRKSEVERYIAENTRPRA